MKKRPYKHKGYWEIDCDGCPGKNMPYSITNNLWSKVSSNTDRFLCLFCVEQRLGRKLASRDFIQAPINEGIFGFHKDLWLAFRRGTFFQTLREMNKQ